MRQWSAMDTILDDEIPGHSCDWRADAYAIRIQIEMATCMTTAGDYLR